MASELADITHKILSLDSREDALMEERSKVKKVLHNRAIRTGSLSAPDFTVPTTINPKKSRLWDPNLGPSSPSRTHA